MFDVYEGKYKITDNPISYNHLLKMFAAINVSWNKVSSLPYGECINLGEFTIVRIT